MTLRNEIFEGLGAAKMARDLVWDPQRKYAEEMYKVARRENQDAEDRDKAREETIKAGRPPVQQPQIQLPTVVSTATPGAQPTAMDTGGFMPTTQPVPPGSIVDRWGGSKMPVSATAPAMPRMPMRTPRFQHGGMVQDEQGMPYRESQPFNAEEDGYDYDQARAAGLGPDETGHWPSREPGSGLQLKGRKHPTFDKAIETDRMQGYGLEKQNGRYYTKPMKGYADGGMVEDDDSAQNEADLIVRSIISRDLGMPPGGGTNEIGAPDDLPPPDFRSEGNRQLDEGAATAKINREVGEPWTVTGPSSEYQTQGARDRLKNEGDLAGRQALDATRMQESGPPAKGRSRLERATDWMRPDPAAMGQAERRRKLRREINQTEPGLTEELTDSELRQREEKAAELRGQIGQSHAYGAPDVAVPSMPDMPKVALNLGSFTPPMGPAAMTRSQPATPLGASTTATARREINETGGTPQAGSPQGPYPLKDYMPEMAPAGAPGPAPTPVPGPNTAQAMSPESAAAQGDRPTGNVRPPNQTPGGGVAVATNGAAVPATPNGPPNTSRSGPTGTASSPAPPMGSADVNTPSTAPKPVQQALNVQAPPAMKGSLRDQSRITAYDPVADADDPNNARRVDAGGRAYSPEEIQQVLGGAASVAKTGPNGEPPPVGQGTVSRGNFNAYVQHHNQGGKFSPGEAMLAGMMSDYKMLLKQGRIQQANMMAYGLIQAASIEAASYGRVAGDMLRQGNVAGALDNVVKGANYLPDGMTFKVGPDGKSIVATNNAGQVTAQQPVTPQQILAMVTGLADGTLLWQALQSSAAMLQKPDRNAEGRALSNQIKRNNLTLQEMKIKKGMGGGAAAGPSAAASEISQRLAALGGGQPQRPTVIVNNQGSDDGVVNEPAEISDE